MFYSKPNDWTVDLPKHGFKKVFQNTCNCEKLNRITWKCGSGLARTYSQIERVARRFLIGGEAARRCQWVDSRPIM